MSRPLARLSAGGLPLSSPPVGDRVRVLVVEDDPDTLAAVATTLRDADEFAVWVARDADQALAVADELGYDADVLVLDLDLGHGIPGARAQHPCRGRAPQAVRRRRAGAHRPHLRHDVQTGAIGSGRVAWRA
ncbi:MAG: response regulator [Chloroflexi bacterium]|nr:MAG: response regulator [Chloroflexota bacterium]